LATKEPRGILLMFRSKAREDQISFKSIHTFLVPAGQNPTGQACRAQQHTHHRPVRSNGVALQVLGGVPGQVSARPASETAFVAVTYIKQHWDATLLLHCICACHLYRLQTVFPACRGVAMLQATGTSVPATSYPGVQAPAAPWPMFFRVFFCQSTTHTCARRVGTVRFSAKSTCGSSTQPACTG
jgi:hypothetical protein